MVPRGSARRMHWERRQQALLLLLLLLLGSWATLARATLVLRASAPPPPSPPSPPSAGWKLVWSDEFDGPAGAPPNASYWSVAGVPGNGVDPTHGPVEQQLYVPEAVALDGKGHVVIETKRERVHYPGGSNPPRWYNFTSGWLQSKGKVNATYGKWAVRARLPDPAVRGIWPAHWMIPEPNSWCGKRLSEPVYSKNALVIKICARDKHRNS